MVKKIIFIPGFILVFAFSDHPGHAQEPLQEKVIFANSLMTGGYFYSETTYQAPSWIANSKQRLVVSEKNFTPGNSLVLEYISAAKGSWQGKILYRPVRGIDFFKPATHVVFRLNVGSETSVEELPKVGVGDKDQKPSRFLSLQPYVESFSKDQWLRVKIPIKDFSSTLDVATVNAIVFTQPDGSPSSKLHRVYVDQIELLGDETDRSVQVAPQLLSATGFEKHVDIAWTPVRDEAVKYIKVYRSDDGKIFQPVAIQLPQINRYADFTGVTGKKYYYKVTYVSHAYKESAFSKVVSDETSAMTDEQWLDMIQRANFLYYWEGAETVSGLSPENIPGRRNMIASGASGFGMMALLVGAERKFISREQLVERFDKITLFLGKADTFHGAFSHFIDGPTGKVEPFFGERDNGGDLVETSFLLQGLLAARQYFNGENEKERAIRNRIQKLWEGVEWSWYRKTADSKFLFWHWSPDQEWVINHKLIGWNETMITYLLAIASPTHPVPASLYYTGWASREEEAQKYRSSWGQTTDGDDYTNGNAYYGVPLKVGVSNGGPLFFVHYSFLGPDPHKIKDKYTDYFTNNRNIALINYRYCVENPEKHQGYGADCWGLTASDGPWNYSANEPVLHADEGKMTPTGALASFPYLPNESMAALKNYYHQYGKFLWGEYGFRDAFNLDENWCAEIYMGLNQAPVAVMIENYRTALLWNLFMKDKDVQEGLRKLEVEGTR
jgi:hypothetical protein